MVINQFINGTMTQKDKQLLLKDLCARLPYGVHIFTNSKHHHRLSTISRDDDYDEQYWIDGLYDVDEIKPYLRPMSSMTEEERKQLLIYVLGDDDAIKYFEVKDDGSIDNTDAAHQDLNNFNIHWVNFDGETTTKYIDWLLKNHFDFMGLIPKNLAIEVTEENNPYKE